MQKRVHSSGLRWVKFRDKAGSVDIARIRTQFEAGDETRVSRTSRKIGRKGEPGYINFVRRIHGNSESELSRRASSQVSGVEQLSTGGINLRNERGKSATHIGSQGLWPKGI